MTGESNLGTIVKLGDGRIGTVVYNGLDGVGIRWGEHIIDKELAGKFSGTCGGLFAQEVPKDMLEWCPEAMLREPYPNADLPCVGRDFEIIQEGIGL